MEDGPEHILMQYWCSEAYATWLLYGYPGIPVVEYYKFTPNECWETRLSTLSPSVWNLEIINNNILRTGNFGTTECCQNSLIQHLLLQVKLFPKCAANGRFEDIYPLWNEGSPHVPLEDTNFDGENDHSSGNDDDTPEPVKVIK